MTVADMNSVDKPVLDTGTPDWVVPFATKKPQSLNLDIQTWSGNDNHRSRGAAFETFC